MTTTQDEEQRRRLTELETLTRNLVHDVSQLKIRITELERHVTVASASPNRQTDHMSSVDPRIVVCSNCLAAVERDGNWIAVPNGHAVRPDGSLKCSGNRA